MQQVAIDEIVREYMLSIGQDSMHQYPIFLQHAIRGLREMTYDVSGVLKIAQLNLTSNYTLILPDDCIRVAKLGMLQNDGRLMEIYHDERILPAPNNEATIANSQKLIIGVNSSPSTLFRNGEPIGREYGNEGGGIYTYNINYASGTISFSSNVTAPITVLYLADPTRVNGKYMVHPFLVDPILKYIDYASIRFKRSIPAGERDRAYNVFLRSKHHANLQFVSESLGNLYNASRKTFNLSAKF